MGYQTPISTNETIPGTSAFGGGLLALHHHDGNEWFTTAKMGSAISGPTLWYMAGDRKAIAINALTGKQELNFSTYTGRNMIPGDGPGTTYHSVGPGNVVVD